MDGSLGLEGYSAIVIIGIELLIGEQRPTAYQTQGPVSGSSHVSQNPVQTTASGLRIDQAFLVREPGKVPLQYVTAEPELIGDRLGMHTLDFLLWSHPHVAP